MIQTLFWHCLPLQQPLLYKYNFCINIFVLPVLLPMNGLFQLFSNALIKIAFQAKRTTTNWEPQNKVPKATKKNMLWCKIQNPGVRETNGIISILIIIFNIYFWLLMLFFSSFSAGIRFRGIRLTVVMLLCYQQSQTSFLSQDQNENKLQHNFQQQKRKHISFSFVLC